MHTSFLYGEKLKGSLKRIEGLHLKGSQVGKITLWPKRKPKKSLFFTSPLEGEVIFIFSTASYKKDMGID